MIPRFRCPPAMAKYMSEIWELGEYNFDLRIEGQATILDIGACIGGFARWAQLRWPGAVVHCYEPNPRVHPLLESNVAPMNPAVHVNKVAVVLDDVAKASPTVAFYQGRNNVGESSIVQAFAATEEACEVPCLSVRELPVADIVKLDCEGNEPALLAEYVKVHGAPAGVMLEYHAPEDGVAVCSWAVQHGYQIAKVLEHDPVRGVICLRHGITKWAPK